MIVLWIRWNLSVKYGNIFSLNIGPNYQGRIRDIDVETLQQVGRYIRGEKEIPKDWDAGVYENAQLP